MLEKLKQEFSSPQDEFSLIPFWFLNSSLDKETLLKKIKEFKNKGLDGFVIHPRIGLSKDIPYLGERYMDFVRFIVEEAKELHMKVVLYDEGMYPSGSAHGKVVENNPEYAARGLRMVQHKCQGYTEICEEMERGEEYILSVAAKRTAENTIDFPSAVKLNVNDGKIVFIPKDTDEWVIISLIATFSKGTIRGIHFGEDDGEKDAPLAADLLNEDAMKKFITVTHEAYYAVLKEHFGNTVIAMFTDEPNILGRCVDGKKIKPWTTGFMDWYKSQGNEELDILALWFDIGVDSELKRRNFKKAVNKKLEFSYYKQISDWCKKHNIALTGHPEASDDIGCLKYFQIPGQDVVWRWIGPEDNKGIEGQHSTMGKCASDAARHLGRRRNANECFGCCGPDGRQWEFSADDMKWFMDWLFVRGTNLLYPHAFLYSIEGEQRANERPPDVGPNNSWWKDYNIIAMYGKRMSWLMTDSVNVTSIAVLCEEDHLPWHIVKPLYQNQVEFNYLEDNILVNNCTLSQEFIEIQEQNYDTVIIEDLSKLDNKLNEILNRFSQNGGCIIVYNPTNEKHALTNAIEIEKYEDIVKCLGEMGKRHISLLPHTPDLRVSHVIKEGIDFYLLVNEGEQNIEGELFIRNSGHFEKWDSWSGKIEELELGRVEANNSVVPIHIKRRDSIIICVDKKRTAKIAKKNEVLEVKTVDINGTWVFKRPLGKDVICEKLISWTEYQEMQNFSGEAVYETFVKIEEVSSMKRALLNLGKVCEMAKVYINDKEVGIKMWTPFEFNVTNFITSAEFKLKIEITNSVSNKISKSQVKSGLLGPVALKLFY
jgi:hypothetical protein